MSYSVPGPGVWTSNPALFATGLPSQAYVLVEGGSGRNSARDGYNIQDQSSGGDPYGSYSNDPMLTPNKKPTWYNRTWRTAQKALRQIPAVFQVKSSTKETLAFQKEHKRKEIPVASDNRQSQHNVVLRDKSNRNASPQRQGSAKSPRSKDQQPPRQEAKPINVIQSPPEAEIARVHTGVTVTVGGQQDFRHSFSSFRDLPERIEETDEDEAKAAVPTGPFVAKVYSNYQPRITRQEENKLTSSSVRTESTNVASAFSSYEHLDSREYQKDPYVARINVRNSSEIGMTRPLPQDVKHITRSDAFLNQGRSSSQKNNNHGVKSSKQPRRTRSEMVKNGAGKYNQGKNKNSPRYNNGNAIILGPNGAVPLVQYNGNRIPYGRGVFMGAPNNIYGFGGAGFGGGIVKKHTLSLDRFQQQKHQQKLGLQQRSAVFVAPANDDDDFVIPKENFIMRSNTFNTSNHKNKKHEKVVVVQKEMHSNNQHLDSQIAEYSKPVSSSQPTVETVSNDNKQAEKRDDEAMKRYQLHHTKSGHEDPHALYAKPIKIKRDSSFLERLAKDENDNTIPQPKLPASKVSMQPELNKQSIHERPEVIPSSVASTQSLHVISSSHADSSVGSVSQGEHESVKDGSISPDEIRKRTKSMSSTDMALTGKDVTTDAFKFLEEFDYD